MSIFGQITPPIRMVLRDLLTDDALKVPVTYRKYSGMQWDDVNGVRVSSFTETSMNVVRLRHTDKSLASGFGSHLQVGDQLYLIQYADCPAGMSMKDEIVDEYGRTQSIKDINNIFKLVVAVTVEGGTSAIGA